MTVMAIQDYSSNSGLMLACRDLGYLSDEDVVLDPTFGHGTFWKAWMPTMLFGSDLDAEKSPTNDSVDFTDLPWDDDTFDVEVLDPPYKLNGTPDPTIDKRYGVHLASSWQGRHALIRDGISEAARVLRKKGRLLLKCQNQVCGGKVRWQAREFADHAETVGFELEDELLYPSYRPQPAGRVQQHARRNYSSLLVLKKTR